MKKLSNLNIVVSTVVYSLLIYSLCLVLLLFFSDLILPEFIFYDKKIMFTLSIVLYLLVLKICFLLRKRYMTFVKLVAYASMFLCIFLLLGPPPSGYFADSAGRKRIMTRHKLETLSQLILTYRIEHGKLPDEKLFPEILSDIYYREEEERTAGYVADIYKYSKLIRDGWGREFRYGLLTKNHHAILSSGQDGLFNTKDDIYCIDGRIYWGNRLNTEKKGWKNRLTDLLADKERTEEMQYEIVSSYYVPLKFLMTNEEVEQREGAPDRAIKEARIYLERHPSHSRHAATVQYFIAFIYAYHKKDYTQAIKEFDKLIQNYPKYESLVAGAESEKARLLNEIRRVSDVYKGMTKEELYKVFSDLQQEQKEYRKEGDEEWITFSGITKEFSEDATIFHLVGGKVEGWEPAPK